METVTYTDNICFQDPRIALDHDDPEPMDFYPVCGGAYRDRRRVRAFLLTDEVTEVNCPDCRASLEFRMVASTVPGPVFRTVA